ncbi:MAG: TIGR02594 family protein [Pseudomonadota bacterium]
MVEPRWLTEAKRHVGVKEWAAARHNPAIVGFFRAAGFGGIKDDETPWCAAFVNAVLSESGLIGSGSLLARSFLKWGEPISDAKPGAIAVFRRGQAGWQGHVGFVVGGTPKALNILGGNQSNAVTIASYSRSKLLGFRWPTAATGGE